jgi:hypothetical protein
MITYWMLVSLVPRAVFRLFISRCIRSSKLVMSCILKPNLMSSLSFLIADAWDPCLLSYLFAISCNKPRLLSQLLRQLNIVWGGKGQGWSEICCSIILRTSHKRALKHSSNSASRSSSFEAFLTSRTNVLMVFADCNSCTVSETTAMPLATPERASMVPRRWNCSSQR